MLLGDLHTALELQLLRCLVLCDLSRGIRSGCHVTVWALFAVFTGMYAPSLAATQG